MLSTTHVPTVVNDERTSHAAHQGGGPAGGMTTEAYRLAAVIIHSGSTDARTGRAPAERGHYYALCREGAGEGAPWLEKNDRKVRAIRQDDVLRNERGVFVLAYELVSQPGSERSLDAAVSHSCRSTSQAKHGSVTGKRPASAALGAQDQ